MKAKNTAGKIYVSFKAYLGRSETFCRGFCRGQLTANSPNDAKHSQTLLCS